MNYTLLMTKNIGGGYTVEVLELPGCISEGETKIEAINNIKEAILLYLESIKEIAFKKASNMKDVFIDSIKVNYETV